MNNIRSSFILVTSGSWQVTGNEYDFIYLIFGPVQVLCHDCNKVGSLKSWHNYT